MAALHPAATRPQRNSPMRDGGVGITDFPPASCVASFLSSLHCELRCMGFARTPLRCHPEHPGHHEANTIDRNHGASDREKRPFLQFCPEIPPGSRSLRYTAASHLHPFSTPTSVASESWQHLHSQLPELCRPPANDITAAAVARLTQSLTQVRPVLHVSRYNRQGRGKQTE
jgi:hypothetical protein